MGYRKGLLSTALALVLAACGQTGTQSPQAVGGTAAEPHTPEILGVVQVKFEHIGQPDATVNATVLPSGVESQTLARVGAVTFTQGERGSFATLDGARYLYGTLNVNNAGAVRSNIALLGVSTNLGGGGHTLGDTSLAAATRLSGTSLTPTEARGVLPVNRRALDLNGDVQVVDSQADFQAYREADITSAIANYMAASPYNGYAFPFGFMARSKTNTRLIPAGTAAGTVTLAFRSPPEHTQNPLSSFTWIGLIVADSENRVSTDAFEKDTTRACTAAQSLYGTAPVVMATLRNVTPTTCGRANTTSQSVSTVRTSGPAIAPTTQIPVIAGQVVAWGSNSNGLSTVPPLPAGLSYTAVAGGYYHSLALRSDGQVIAWGDNGQYQTDVTVLPAGLGLTYTAVAGGGFHSLALRSDGQVIAWGYKFYKQIDVTPLPAGLGLTYTAVAAGGAHSLALRSDGQVIAWGYDGNGLSTVPAPPAGLTYTAVAAGIYHSLAIAK